MFGELEIGYMKVRAIEYSRGCATVFNFKANLSSKISKCDLL